MIGPDLAGVPFRAAAFSAPSNRTHHELLLIEVGEDAAALPRGRRVGLYHFGLKVGTPTTSCGRRWRRSSMQA